MCVQDCWTALISAAKEGHIEVVRELLENNANLEHRDMVRIECYREVFLNLKSAVDSETG